MKQRLWILLLVLLMLLNGCANPGVEAGEETVQPPEVAETETETPKPEANPIKPEWKNPAITDAQRKQFYNLVIDYRMDAVPELKLGGTIELDWMKYYCVYFMTDADWEYVNGGTNFSGAVIEKIANERFGISYGLKEGDVVFMKAEGGRQEPMAELIDLKEKVVDGKKVVYARFAEYSWVGYGNYTYPDEHPDYPKHRDQIFKGTANDYQYYSLTDIAYYPEADGITPKQFIYCMGYGYESLRDGYQTLPDFSTL